MDVHVAPVHGAACFAGRAREDVTDEGGEAGADPAGKDKNRKVRLQKESQKLAKKSQRQKICNSLICCSTYIFNLLTQEFLDLSVCSQK